MSKAMELKHPITKGERTVTTLIFPDRILVRHLMAGDGHGYLTVSQDLAILAAATGESEIILKELDAHDWTKAQAEMRTLLIATEEKEDTKEDTKEDIKEDIKEDTENNNKKK